ncbi:MAG TPA: hypothetical protein VLD37_00435 [Candidatus Bilamarchaeum sp.]|nr:hypothetical protein [Candidatus Bilamarchaeum sp.]
MYHALSPREKLLYLAFWKESDISEAAGRCGMSESAAEGMAERLEKTGILGKRGKKYRADLGYIVEIIERDNHFYPHRKLSEADRARFAGFLASEKAASLAYSRFALATALAKDSKEVLGGFFWEVFSGIFALASAYAEVFRGRDSPENRETARKAILAGNKRKRLFEDWVLKGAFDGDFVFSIPSGIVGYLGWSVNQRPERFIARDILAEAMA